MVTQAEPIPTPPTSAVQNTVGKRNEQTLENLNRPTSDAALREYCDKYYHQLLTIIAGKVHKEKEHQDKLKEVKARLSFEGCLGRKSKIQKVSQHSESRTPNRTESISKSEDSGGGHWKSRSKKQKSSIEEDDLSQPWVCEETYPFTPRICCFDFPKKTRILSKVKTYDGSEDPENHLKIFQAATKVECWAMPTWCHMFNSTLTGSARVWFDDLPSKSVDSYDDLKKAFRANFLQQKKCNKNPVKIHNIKQRERESTEDFVQRFKTKSRHVNGARERIRILRFMHGITNPELIKCLHDNISKSVDEMTRRQIEEIKGGKLSHVIKELKQGNRKDQPKAAKKGEVFGKDKALAILMVQPWKRVSRQIITHSFGPDLEIPFPPLGDEDGMEGPMIIRNRSHRTPHCLERRNHMANGTNDATGKNRGCRTFNINMDELCGGKINISIQWDHRKAKRKENSSSPVNGS
uniref:Reverse transcriptase domain-containing protein n=1 Tax=Tanacetum cinerariifolium TaxID=118510 RepID=A0A699I9W2_TANCI|nr:reverse transcriptase domain-containing protein [Tanacetum cinerariifolium]